MLNRLRRFLLGFAVLNPTYMLDPLDAISGELTDPEADMDGNGIPDYLENGDSTCK